MLDIDYDAKAKALSACRFLVDKNDKALTALAEAWSDACTDALRRLCVEALSKRWQWFNSAEVDGWRPKMFISILKALAVDTRPRLIVRAQLMSVLQESK